MRQDGPEIAVADLERRDPAPGTGDAQQRSVQ